MARLFRSFNEISYSINDVKPEFNDVKPEFAVGGQIPASGALAVAKDSPLCDNTGSSCMASPSVVFR